MGIGYQEKVSEETTNRWWEQVYDKAASNLSSTGKSKESDQGTIASSFAKLTDEELFKACGGRTAHKAARHGLRLNGKLERIECQEKKLVVDLANSPGSENVNKEKRKKKRKKSIGEEPSAENSNATDDVVIIENISDEVPPKKEEKHKEIRDSSTLCDKKVKDERRKQRNSNRVEYCAEDKKIKQDVIVLEEVSNEVSTKKRRKRENIYDLTISSDDGDVKMENFEVNNKKNKKHKNSKQKIWKNQVGEKLKRT